ncbi:peptidoglycan-binding protein [Kitasatospora fiedleri]|uniref:peptidoglycan-binding protein n=1 Tax=Kitasatospora fiedleri TaxID=2991545 RepID=UPI00249C87A5|nr:peptidoglycan-binding protein [Kitasatospora fiedleri]
MASTAAAIIAVADAEVGYHEGRSADGSWNNHQKYSPAVPGLEWSDWQAWCATFVSWCAMQSGNADIYPRTASCATGVAWFKQRGQWRTTPSVGAQVFYGSGGGSHTGIVAGYDDTYIHTIEGNTNDNGSANGDGVYRRTRRRDDSYIYGYGAPAFSAAPSTGGTKTVTVKAGQTLSGIAVAAGVALAVILGLNPSVAQHPDTIHPGDVITVPAVPGTTPPQVPVPAPAPAPQPSAPSTGGSGNSAASGGTSAPAWPGYTFRASTAPPYDAAVARWQQRMKDRGWSIAVDGKYGPASAAVARAFQGQKGLAAVDGLVGPVTWRAAWTAKVTSP